MEEINPSVSDILSVLTQWAPIELAEGWDNPGLTIGNPIARVKKILIALDASSSAIDEAVHISADLLITHHPLPLSPIKSVLTTTTTGKRIYKLCQKDIAFISMHTNLDSARDGVNDVLCGVLGLENPQGLHDPSITEGIGRIGELSRPTTLSQFMDTIQEALDPQCIFFTGTVNTLVQRVAVCGGSGGDLWALSMERGADCLVTGEIKHHQALDAQEAGFPIIAAGHFETERPVVYTLKEKLETASREKDWELSIDIFEKESSPLSIYKTMKDKE